MDLGDYHQSGDYIFDADLFNCDKFQNKFNPNGTPKDDTIMNQQGAIQETTLQQNFPNWTNSRVVNITPTTIARYIPLPYTVDPYMRTLLQPAQDQSLDRNDSNEEGDNPMEIENNQNNAGMINNEQNQAEEETDDVSLEERLDSITGIDNENRQENESTQANSTEENSTAPSRSDGEEENTNGDIDIKLSLETLSDLTGITKKTGLFNQYLSNGRIGNVHHKQIVIELVYTDDQDPESQLTVKLLPEMQLTTCQGANIYMPHTRSMFTKQSTKTQQLEALFIPHLLKHVLSNFITTPKNQEYQHLKKLIQTLNERMKELLLQLRHTDRQPIRQELTFATNNLWNYKYRWPSSENLDNCSHIGVADCQHTYFFLQKVCQESMAPLMHITRTPVMPNYTLLSPPAKTCLVYLAEKILTIFQHFGFQGTISRRLLKQFPNQSEACPPQEMVVAISQLDKMNTMLNFGLKPECLPVYVVSPVKLSSAFRKGIQAPTRIYQLKLAENIDMTDDYLLYRQSILAVMQQYSKNSSTNQNNFQGPFMENNDQETIEEDEANNYRQGFFDHVSLQNLAKIPKKSLENLFSDVANLIISAYHQFMLKRINKKLKMQRGGQRPPLTQIPKNTVELRDVIAEEEDNHWTGVIKHSATLINVSGTVPHTDKVPLTTPGMYALQENTLLAKIHRNTVTHYS